MNKSVFVVVQLRFAHFGDDATSALAKGEFEAFVDGLNDSVTFCSEMYAQFGMALDYLFNSIGKLQCIGARRESEQIWDVVKC